MMNERIITTEKVKFIKGIECLETNIGITLRDAHEADWCEVVYADWSSLDDTPFFDTEFDGITLQFIKDVGFRINGYLINCYNYQNGYYSSELELYIFYPTGESDVIDITSYVEDHID